MITKLKAFPLLNGYRGSNRRPQRTNRVLVNVSKMVLAIPEIKEWTSTQLWLPVGAKCVDARIILE
jgi:hypothetical protein